MNNGTNTIFCFVFSFVIKYSVATNSATHHVFFLFFVFVCFWHERKKNEIFWRNKNLFFMKMKKKMKKWRKWWQNKDNVKQNQSINQIIMVMDLMWWKSNKILFFFDYYFTTCFSITFEFFSLSLCMSCIDPIVT